MTNDKLDLDELERLIDKLSKYRESALAMLNGGVTGVARQECLDEANTIALIQNAAPKLFERVRELEALVQDRQEWRSRLGLKSTDDVVKENDTLRARIAELEGAMRADSERLEQAAIRIGEHGWGCDTPDHMAETILELRARITELERHCARNKCIDCEMDDVQARIAVRNGEAGK